MRRLLLAAVLAFSPVAFADEWVDGYTKSDGTYVPGHWRTKKNTTKNDNYGTEGNWNPYTGEKGTKKGDSYDDVFKPKKNKKKSGGY